MRRIATVALLGGCCWGMPAIAHACGTCDIGEYLELPGPQDVRPANALILANTSDAASLAAISIDDDPAKLVPAGIAWPYDRTTWRIEPMPPAGALVDFGGYAPPVCFGEETRPLQYVAAAPDLDPPPSPVALVLDVHAYAYVDTTSCPVELDTTYWLRGELVEQEYVRVEAVANGTRLALVHEQPPTGPFTIEFRVALGEIDPVDVCVRVSTMDIAGNESEVVELCDPCHLRDERDAPEPYTSAPEEPEWSEADIVPDGVCAPTEPPSDESSTSDGTEGSESGSEPDATTTSTTDLATGGSPSDSGVVDRGCACGSAPPSAFPLLVLLAIRRRRATRRAPW